MTDSFDGTSSEPDAPRRVGMRDVARLAGVSHQTVSRVLNGRPYVRPETRAQVLEAVRVLNYRLNTAARTLTTGRSRTIGVIALDPTLYGPASTLFGIERAVQSTDHYVTIASVFSFTTPAFHNAIERLLAQGVDGIIVIAPERTMTPALLQMPPAVPVTVVGSNPVLSDLGIPSVACDQVDGGVQATEHLLELGHETVWHISGPETFWDAQQRVDGWRRALEAAGAPVHEPLAGDWTPRTGYEHGLTLGRDPQVTAIFVANDQMTLGVVRALAKLGRRVPDDISIVGFDDIPEAGYFAPPLTTVRQDLGELGRLSLQLMLGRLDPATARPAPDVVPVELVVRDSAAPPKRPA